MLEVGYNPCSATKLEAEVTPKLDENKLTYKGFFKAVNEEPSEFIEIFVSDWNKDHWAFYAYIDKDNYEEDIEQINQLMTELNYRDGDVYIELINHSEDLESFYSYLYDLGKYTQSDVLNKEYWEILEEKEDDHFYYFVKLNGSSYIEDLKNAEFITFEDWYEVLELYNPDLYKALDESNGLCCFDIEHFYNCSGFYELNDCIVEEIN